VVLRRAGAAAGLGAVDSRLRSSGSGEDGPVLSVRSLGKDYAIGRGEPKVAVQEVSFDLPRGEFVCVVGPSGAGKTTLLRCLAGLSSPTRGDVLLDGAPVQGASEHVGVVFQD
jgi:NitT/TauT family transport system ATP-binding protein